MRDFDVTGDRSVFIKGICDSESFRFLGKQLAADQQAGHANQVFLFFLLFGYVAFSEIPCLSCFIFLLWIVSVQHHLTLH